MIEKLFDLIEKFDTICIYRHVNPDGDANGSQFGMKKLIEQLYPEKKVYALGNENKPTFFPSCYHDPIDFSEALAIVCDTANRERIDGEGYDQCKMIVKIDHHPIVDDYGDFTIVDEKACATCEVISQMLMEHHIQLSKEAATYLYCGLLTDSQKFSINSVSEKTFQVAAYLSSFQINLQLINQKMYAGNLKEFRYETFLRSKAEFIEERIAYIIADQNDYEQFQLTFEKAKEKVFVLANIEEIEIYCLFTQKSDQTYTGSLRSKNTVMNDIAASYHGGGHKLASGVKNLTLEDIHSLLEDLLKRYHETQA